MSESLIDVAIIGGGLAGGAAAIVLATEGRRVLVLEQHRYPRHKMCGEFLSPETVPLFQRLGVWESIQAAKPAHLTATRITVPDGRQLDVPLPAAALGLSRYRLDALLLARAREAGARVEEDCAVSALNGSLDEGFVVETRSVGRVRARVVLGAWGKRSRLDRVLDRPFFRQPARFLALKAHFRGPEPEQRTELHAFPGGYCGINRVEGDAVNVCLLATEEAWTRSDRDIDSFWAMIQRANPALARQLDEAERLTDNIVISNISFARKRPVERDVLMLGDSAKLISPLAGNGQAMAMTAALLAAPLVDGFLQGEYGAGVLRRGYALRWKQRFRKRLLLGGLLQPLFLTPAALALSLRLVSAVPPLAGWLVKGTREEMTTNSG